MFYSILTNGMIRWRIVFRLRFSGRFTRHKKHAYQQSYEYPVKHFPPYDENDCQKFSQLSPDYFDSTFLPESKFLLNISFLRLSEIHIN